MPQYTLAIPLVCDLHWLPSACNSRCWLLPIKPYLPQHQVFCSTPSVISACSTKWIWSKLMLFEAKSSHWTRRRTFSVAAPSLWNELFHPDMSGLNPISLSESHKVQLISHSFKQGGNSACSIGKGRVCYIQSYVCIVVFVILVLYLLGYDSF